MNTTSTNPSSNDALLWFILIMLMLLCMSASGQTHTKAPYSKNTVTTDSISVAINNGCRKSRYKLVRSSNSTSTYRSANGESVTIKKSPRGVICVNGVKYIPNREYYRKEMEAKKKK